MGTTSARRPVLVVGVPRSGTTWVGQVLGLAQGVRSVHEPDNEANVPLAVKAKRNLGRFPVLGAHDTAPPDYERLWEAAFDGRVQAKTPRWYAAKLLLKRVNRSELRAGFCEPTHPHLSARLRAVAALAAQPPRGDATHTNIVKSINAALCVEWVAARFNPRVVVVVRHPLNVIASWLELGWKECGLDRHPRVREGFFPGASTPTIPPNSGPLGRLTWQIGLLTGALEAEMSRHPDWIVVSHETLCRDPNVGFRHLYDALDLAWSHEVDAFLEEVNRPGTGTDARRIASEQPERWRRRLDAGQVQEIRSVLAGFRLKSNP
jgi:Sulfotransferase family